MEGLSDRGAAHPQFFGQMFLGQPLPPGIEVPGKDVRF